MRRNTLSFDYRFNQPVPENSEQLPVLVVQLQNIALWQDFCQRLPAQMLADDGVTLTHVFYDANQQFLFQQNRDPKGCLPFAASHAQV